MSLFTDLLGGAVDYGITNSAINRLRDLGQTTKQQLGDLGSQLKRDAEFKPYTVTSDLATVETTGRGGVDVGLGEEEKARQAARFGQAEGLLGRIGVDPAVATQEYFEAIRAPQRIEEERQRQGLAQSLFTRGRGGITSPEFGTTAEEFAFEKARQEAMLAAGAGARQQALNEQQQALEQAGFLTDLAYAPQQQAIDLFSAANLPAQLAQRGQLEGVGLLGDLKTRGLERRLDIEEQIANLKQRRLQDLVPLLTGTVGASGQAEGGAIDYLFGDGGLFGDIVSLFGGGSGSTTSTGDLLGSTITGGGTSGGSSGASQAGAYEGEFGPSGPGNIIVDAPNYLPDDYNILDDQ